jgi:hypothetical protein
MGGRTRPSIIFCLLNNVRTNGVPLNIGHHAPEVGLVENRRFESSLKHMADFLIFGIEITCIFPENAMEDFTQSAIPIGNRDVVDMVVHQCIGPDPNTVVETLRFEELEIDATVGIVEKDICLSVSAMHNVIGVSGKEIAMRSGHKPSKVRGEIPRRNSKGVDSLCVLIAVRNFEFGVRVARPRGYLLLLPSLDV